MIKYPEFNMRMAQAREDQGDYMDDRILGVMEQVEKGYMNPDAGRLLISAMQWRASRLKPKRYGDKVTLAGDAENPLQFLASRLDMATRKKKEIGHVPDMIDVTPIYDGSDLL